MKIVVIPDIHEAENVATDVEAALARELADVAVFLGDFFDRYYDTPTDAERIARWLKVSLLDPARVHLLGNHDLAYRFPRASEAYCSGFTAEKSAAINSVLMSDDWAKLRFTYWRGNLLFSHAGWSAHFAPPVPNDIPSLRRYLEAQEYAAIACLEENQWHWFYHAGRRRGGGGPAGGLVWCDAREFTPILGLNQIFGHTPRNVGAVISGAQSVNVCLDSTDQTTGVNHYLRVESTADQTKVSVCHIRGATVKEVSLG